MTCDAVVLTRLEWDRLVSCGWLRLHNARLTRVDDWSLSSAQLHFDILMKTAPDVGISSSDYVLAELRYEVWPLIATHDFQLGRMLKLDQVQHFLCFDERACQVLNATYNGPIEYAVQLFQTAQLWIDWRERISHASEDNRAARLLEHFGLPSPFEEFKQKPALFFDRLPDIQRSLSGIKHYEHAKGTRAFGWIVALAISKKNHTTEADPNVKSMVKELQSEYSVDVPFFMNKSVEVADAVFSDPQYKEVYNALVVCAAYVHYTYLIERSSYKKFGYNAFCQDVEWLKKQHINLAAQLVEKTACYMSDELLSRVLSQNPKISAKSSASSEGNALTAGALSTDTSETPDTAPNLEDAGKKEATSALPSPSSVSSTPPVPEKSLAHLVADSTGGYQANKPDITGIAADTPQGQSTTKVNADAAPAPEEQIEPNAEAEEVSGTLGQSESTDPGAGNEYSEESVLAGATGADQESATEPAKKSDDSGLPSDDPKGNDSAQSPINGDGCTSAPIEPPFNTNAKKMEVAKRVREKGLEKVCEEMSLKPQQVQKWVDKFDQKLSSTRSQQKAIFGPPDAQ